MEEREYLYMYEEEEQHWWYVGMRSIVLSLLPPDSVSSNSHVLDAGCGSGFNLGWLRKNYAATVTGTDLSVHALHFCRRRGERALVQADSALLPFADACFDLVVSFDMLTEMESESARAEALREFLRILKPGGRLLIRVAAYEALRSSHDEAVMTLHRYGRRELSSAIKAAGFQLLRATSANTILFPAAALWRILKKTGLAPSGSDVGARTRGGHAMNRAFTAILQLEAAMVRRVNLGFGLSIYILAEKPAAAKAAVNAGL